MIRKQRGTGSVQRILRLSGLLVISLAAGVVCAQGITLRNTVTGEVLDLTAAKPAPETPAVREFLATGRDVYRWDMDAIKKGGELFLIACSGCHGHEAEGKVGPALRDDYWTYPKNGKTDQGLFETIFGGADAMMGPQYKHLTIDEMLHIIAWIRAIYVGDVQKAEWMNEEEKRSWKGPWIKFTDTADSEQQAAQ